MMSESPDLTEPLGVNRRALKVNEFAPDYYFRRLERAELVADPDRALEVDLGCGDGDFLVGMAAEHPEREYLGVERLLGRVDKVGRKIRRAGLSNARTLRLEIDYAVRWLLPLESVARLHLLCPDPWPKMKHHKNRNFRPDFLEAIAQVLEPAGEFLFMTDHHEYFQWAEKILVEQVDCLGPLFEQLPWKEEDFFYPKTGFQLQWEAQGKSMHRIRLRKK